MRKKLLNAFDAACKNDHMKILLKFQIQIAHRHLTKITYRKAFRKKFLSSEFQICKTKHNQTNTILARNPAGTANTQ